LVILIVSANLSEHEPKGITKYFNGPYYDYSTRWYTSVGTKVTITLVIETIIPFVRLFKTIVVGRFKMCYDSRGTMDRYKTRKTSVIAYKEVYAGGDVEIHLLYAETLKIVYCAMLYGLCMPMLFPLAALSIASKRFIQRILIGWHYRMPPSMDDRMTR